jgi:hypothetical protein
MVDMQVVDEPRAADDFETLPATVPISPVDAWWLTVTNRPRYSKQP